MREFKRAFIVYFLRLGIIPPRCFIPFDKFGEGVSGVLWIGEAHNFAGVGDTGGRFWSKMKDRSRGLSVIDHVVMAKSNSSVTSIWRLTETFESSFDSVFLPFSVRCRSAAFCSSTRFSSGSSCGGLFGFSFVSVVTESLLNLLGKLSEVNFRDFGLVYQHNAIWFDTAYLGVLVFAPFDGFEVLGECEGRGQCKLIVQFSSTSRRGRDSALLLSTRQRQSDINVRGTQAM